MKKSLAFTISVISLIYIAVMLVAGCLIYKYYPESFTSAMIIISILLAVAAIMISVNLASDYSRYLNILKTDIQRVIDGEADVRCNPDLKYEYKEIAEMLDSLHDSYKYSRKQLTDSKDVLSLTEQKLENKASQIRHISSHDVLTGLLNRTTFMKRANAILHAHTESFDRFAILYIDVDNFKNINDMHGHMHGDLLLSEISKKLSRYVKENDEHSSDLLARTGGDEFIILKDEIGSNEELEEYARGLIDILSDTYRLEDATVTISVSIGISLFPYDGLSIDELIKDADIAMYVAKDSGKSRYMIFNSDMEDAFNRRVGLKTLLSDVIQKNNIYLMYQAQADLLTGQVSGFEALMRIRSDSSENLKPSEFIPIAENSGLITELGEWVIFEACRFTKKLMDMGYGPLNVAVNVSTDQLNKPGFIDAIKSVPDKTGLELKNIEIEITESILMEDLEANLVIINAIKELGARVALDDFGTCYSSFNYLTNLPVDVIKIDKSFIDGICTNEKDTYITESMIALAHKLDMTVVAEGVENIEQLKLLQKQGCDRIQGYLFSRPLDENGFIEFLEINR